MPSIRLFTSAYRESDTARQAELADCLKKNLGNSELDGIYILSEDSSIRLPHSDKLVIRGISGRPRYDDYFQWISESSRPGDISIIANSDIYFDSGITLLRRWALPHRTAFALARWDVNGVGARLRNRNDSQDAWIFSGPVAGVNGDFCVGVPRCDNRIAYELEIAGYVVENPAFALRSLHLHSGHPGEYPIENTDYFVPGPYKYLWPHNVWSLPRTLMYNALHPHERLHWRLDKRLISTRLRFSSVRRRLARAAATFSPARHG
jgi:hypothetical protein